VVAVSHFDLPGWIVPVGLIGTGAAIKGWENRAS
jgi:hypothetical protein